MDFLWDRIPVRDQYKDTRDQAVKLKGPAVLVRACFLIEIAAFCLAFVLSYYYAALESTTETIINYEVMDEPYSCQVLSPKSTGEFLSTVSSEAVQFSSVRYTYNECVEMLGSDNLDVCGDTNRDDFLVSVTGVASNDDTCKDLLLTDNYRFCYGSETEFVIDSSSATSTQFPTQTDKIDTTFSNVYYFTQGSGHLHTIDVSFSELKTDFISDNMYNAFVIAKSTTDNQMYLYKLSPFLTSAVSLQRVTYSTFYGIVYGNDVVYSYSISGVTGTIFAYNLLNSTYTSMVIDCSAYISSSSTPFSSATTYRYISYDRHTNLLYVMCTGDTSVKTTVIVQGQPPSEVTSYVFSFYQVDYSSATSRALNANIYALNYSSAFNTERDPVQSITQVLVVNDVAIAYTGGQTANVISIDLTSQPTAIPTLVPSPLPTTQQPVPQMPTKPTPPSPTFNPTPIPTESPSLGLSEQYYTFSGVQGLTGISATTYIQDLVTNNAVFKQTIKDIIVGLEDSDITVNNVTDTAVTSHSQRRHDVLTTQCFVDYTIRYNIAQLRNISSTDSAVVYWNITATLTVAVAEGDFEAKLQANALSSNANTLLNVEIAAITLSELFKVTNGPSTAPTVIPASQSQQASRQPSPGEASAPSPGSVGSAAPTVLGNNPSENSVPTSVPQQQNSAPPSLGQQSAPSMAPTSQDSAAPSTQPQGGGGGGNFPSMAPSVSPVSYSPTHSPVPTNFSSNVPSEMPSVIPSWMSSVESSTVTPSQVPSAVPLMAIDSPTQVPVNLMPTEVPTVFVPQTSTTSPTTMSSEMPSTTPASASASPSMSMKPNAAPPIQTVKPTVSGNPEPQPTQPLPPTGSRRARGRRLAEGNPVLQPVYMIGAIQPDSYLVSGYGSTIYSANSGNTYINVTSAVDVVIDKYVSYRQSYFYGTSFQLAYSYSVCNGNNTHVTVDPTYGGDFYSQCGLKNGIYYQNNKYFAVPDSCVGSIASVSDLTISSLLTCADITAVYDNFTSSNCEESFDSVCTIAYTDNPPFSCSKVVLTSALTLFANAFSNASFVMSVTVIFISFGLKRVYPNGISYTKKVKVVDGEMEVEVNLANQVVDPELLEGTKLKEKDVVAFIKKGTKGDASAKHQVSQVAKDVAVFKAKTRFSTIKKPGNQLHTGSGKYTPQTPSTVDSESNVSGVSGSGKFSLKNKGPPPPFTAGFKTLFKANNVKMKDSKVVPVVHDVHGVLEVLRQQQTDGGGDVANTNDYQNDNSNIVTAVKKSEGCDDEQKRDDDIDAVQGESQLLREELAGHDDDDVHEL